MFRCATWVLPGYDAGGYRRRCTFAAFVTSTAWVLALRVTMPCGQNGLSLGKEKEYAMTEMTRRRSCDDAETVLCG